MKVFFILVGVLTGMGIGRVKAQYPILYSFNGIEGANPSGSLTLYGNKLYGMAGGGAYSEGCIFSIDTDGNGYKDMYDFNSASGTGPYGSLIASVGKLYGMTNTGGKYDNGCIFAIDTSGNAYQNLYSFNGTNGANTTGSLILSGKELYGMTLVGGPNNMGCVFSMDTDGYGYRVLLYFNGSNGAYPEGNLMLVGKTLFGMASSGGATDSTGCIFSIDTDGTGYKALFDFSAKSGFYPVGSLSFSVNLLYGITEKGGLNNYGCLFCIDTNGSVYRDLYDFTLGTKEPSANIIISGKTIYATSVLGGVGYGNVFSLDTDGTNYTDMFNFNQYKNGGEPAGWGSLVLHDSILYGMTYSGGAYTYGTIFEIYANSVASINELNTNSGGVRVYPNPNNGIFTLTRPSPFGEGVTTVEIYNMLGELVKSEELRGESTVIDISNQSSGVYLYRVVTETGDLLGEGKFIIEK